MYIQKQKFILFASCWSLLGFKRGMDSYDYSHKERCNSEFKSNKSYLYSSKICYGLYGWILYVNPIFLGITIPKEIYRFEVYMRNMEEEKKSDYYNELW